MVGASLVTKWCLTIVTPWTVAHQAPLSMGFSRQEDWSGLPFPSPGDLPDPGIEPWSSAFQVDSLLTELGGKAMGLISILIRGTKEVLSSLHITHYRKYNSPIWQIS